MTMSETMTSAPQDEDFAPLPLMKDGIYVCPLSAVDELIVKLGCSHLVTLINHETMIETPRAILPGKHLKLAMNDIVEPRDNLVPPHEAHVEELIAFTKSWRRDAPMLVHCWAGISRSTAAAFISLCTLNPERNEGDIAQRMRKLSPTAYPNRMLVSLADDILGREGRMVDAVDALGRGEMAMEGVIFGLQADLK